GGDTQLTFGRCASSLRFNKSGRLRGLAATTPKRIPAAPDLPTVAEAAVPGYEVVLWHGLVGPKGLPSAVVERINQAANDALKSKDVADLLATDGVAPAGGAPETFRALITADNDDWSN